MGFYTRLLYIWVVEQKYPNKQESVYLQNIEHWIQQFFFRKGKFPLIYECLFHDVTEF